MGYRIERYVAHGDAVCRMGDLPLADELLGELAGNGILLARTAFDDQNIGHGFVGSIGNCCKSMERRLTRAYSIKKRKKLLQPI